MAQGPRHLGDSFVSTGLRFTAQTLSAAQQAQVQTNLNLPDATEIAAELALKADTSTVDTALALKADELNASLTTPTIDGVLHSALNARQLITVAFSITGAALHAANLTAVTFPAAAVILRAVLDVTTVSTGVATVDIGYTAVSATTASDTMFDGVDVNTGVTVFDFAAPIKAASGKWVTIHETADTTGMVAVLYVTFILA